jgi:hypothetical protein
MTREAPAGARELASRLAALFRSDAEIVARLNDAQRRLVQANDRLWSGLHRDALGFFDEDARWVAVGAEPGGIAGHTVEALGRGGGGVARTELLRALQRTHWTIHRAFVDFQRAAEERRQLAVDVGELAQQLTEALTAAGWSEDAARDADVHELAAAGAS